MKFINKLRFAFLVVFVIGPLVWAEQTTLPPLPIPDSVVVKNLNVKNTEIRDLLQGLAVQYGLNLFLAPDVKGPVTVNFSNQPLKSALRVLLQGNGYEYVVDGGVIRVQKPVEKIPEPPKPPEKRFKVEWNNNALTIDVEDAPLDKLVRTLVETTGKNILLDQGNSKPVSVYVQNLPFDRAMRHLAESAELDYEYDDGVISLKKMSWNLGGKANEISNKFKVRLINDSLLNIEAVEAPLASLLSEVLSQTKSFACSGCVAPGHHAGCCITGR